MPTTQTSQKARCAQPRYHYPVRSTPERCALRAVPIEKLSRQWLHETLAQEQVRHSSLSRVNRSRCESVTMMLWAVAESVLSKRFYTLMLDADEFGASHMQEAARELLAAGMSEPHETFIRVLALRMVSHLMTGDYVSITKFDSAPSMKVYLPTDIALLGKDKNDRYLNSERCRKDSLLLGGKLIAETEQLLLELAEFCRNTILSNDPAIQKEKITSGMPDLYVEKHWDNLAWQTEEIQKERTEERRTRASELAQRATERKKVSKQLVINRSEALLKLAFGPKRGVDA